MVKTVTIHLAGDLHIDISKENNEIVLDVMTGPAGYTYRFDPNMNLPSLIGITVYKVTNFQIQPLDEVRRALNLVTGNDIKIIDETLRLTLKDIGSDLMDSIDIKLNQLKGIR